MASLPIRQLGAVGGWLDALGEAKARYARIVIDLPAVLSPALAAAFLAADAILIPTSFSPVDLLATRRTVRHARVAAAERPARPPLILAVPMLIRRDWTGRPETPTPRHRALEVPFADAVGYDPAFGEAFERSDWIGGHAPRTRAHRELLAVVDRVEAGLGEDGRGVFGGVRQPVVGRPWPGWTMPRARRRFPPAGGRHCSRRAEPPRAVEAAARRRPARIPRSSVGGRGGRGSRAGRARRGGRRSDRVAARKAAARLTAERRRERARKALVSRDGEAHRAAPRRAQAGP